jgi:hypothetical protein
MIKSWSTEQKIIPKMENYTYSTVTDFARLRG